MKNALHYFERPQLLPFCAAVLSLCLGGVIATSTPVSADDTCSQPPRPEMPDGTQATMEAMLAGQKSVKKFQTSNMEYMQCLERKYSAAETTAKRSKDAVKKSQARTEYAKSIDAYNAAVSAEEAVAGDFNVARRAYMAANK